jgi:hypothetical protein
LNVTSSGRQWIASLHGNAGPSATSVHAGHNANRSVGGTTEGSEYVNGSMSASSAKTDIIVRGRAGSRLITINAHSAGAQIKTCASEAPPSEQLGELFRNVQLKGIFPDSKTFADLHFDESPKTILADYKARKVESGFDLGAFIHQHFSLPTEGPTVAGRTD